MTAFVASTSAEAVVPVERARVWDGLVDPDLVARFTPFIKSINVDGNGHWIWHMSGLTVLGKGFSATFTERMTLEEGKRIEFTHDPPPGGERAAVNGWYDLADTDEQGGGVLLRTSLEICVDLPAPKMAGPAVRGAMKGAMATMGDRFSKNLLNHLGVRG